MAVIISRQMTIPSQPYDHIITFSFQDQERHISGEIWASVTLPDGRVINHDNQIEVVGVHEGDTIRIFVIGEQVSNTGGIFINANKVVNSVDTVGTFYDYTVTKNITVDVDIWQTGTNDSITGEYLPAYCRGLVKIIEL